MFMFQGSADRVTNEKWGKDGAWDSSCGGWALICKNVIFSNKWRQERNEDSGIGETGSVMDRNG